MTDKIITLFDVSQLFQLHLRKQYSYVNTHQTLKEYLTKLSVVFRTKDDVVTHQVTYMGMNPETLYFKLGHVVFALNENYDANPDGVNIEMFITPLYYYDHRGLYGVSMMNYNGVIQSKDIIDETLIDLMSKLTFEYFDNTIMETING